MSCKTTSQWINSTSYVKTFSFRGQVDKISDWLRRYYDIDIDAFGPSDKSHRWQMQLRTKSNSAGKRRINLNVKCSRSTMALVEAYIVDAKSEKIRLTDERKIFRNFVSRKSYLLCEDLYDFITVNGVVILPNDTLDILCQISELESCREVTDRTENPETSRHFGFDPDMLDLSINMGTATFAPSAFGGKQHAADDLMITGGSPSFRDHPEAARRQGNHAHRQKTITPATTAVPLNAAPIVIPAVDGLQPEAAAAMLSYVKTGILPEIETRVVELLIPAADKYVINGLKALCESKLEPTINEENAMAMLLLAARNNAGRLKTSTVRVIAGKLNEYCASLDDDALSLIVAEMVAKRRP